MVNNALKKIMIGFLSMLVIFTAFAAVNADQSLFIIEDVDIDDPYHPGDIMSVDITLENNHQSKDVEDIKVRVWIEDDDNDKITNKVRYDIKRIANDREKDFCIDIQVPKDAVDDDDYTLHITAEGEWDGKENVEAREWVEEFEVEQANHKLNIESVKLYTNHVFSGETVDVAIDVANTGKEDESNVNVKVEIPEINAEKTVSLLNTIGSGYDYTTYLTLEIPDAESGVYTLVAKVYNANTGDIYEQDIVVEKVTVMQNTDGSAPITTSAAVAQTIAQGKGSIFSIQVANNANTAKAFTFGVGGIADWATGRVDPGQLVIGPGESELVQVYVMPNQAGEHTFTLFVKEDGVVTAANQVKVDVAGSVADTQEFSEMQNVFAFLILVFIVVTAGFLYKHRNNDKKSKQVYY